MLRSDFVREKLYEELLIQTDELTKTENERIFIDHDEPLSPMEIEYKLELLKKACESGDDAQVRQVLHEVVPTFKDADEVNAVVEGAEEMQEQLKLATTA